jgi:hypothetical protein
MAKFHIGQLVKVIQTSMIGFEAGTIMLVKDIEPRYTGEKTIFIYTCEFVNSIGDKWLTYIEERFLVAAS